MLFTMRLGSGLGLEARPLGRKWTTTLDGWCEELGLTGFVWGWRGRLGWGCSGGAEFGGVIGDGVDVRGLQCGTCDEPLREGSERGWGLCTLIHQPIFVRQSLGVCGCP